MYNIHIYTYIYYIIRYDIRIILEDSISIIRYYHSNPGNCTPSTEEVLTKNKYVWVLVSVFIFDWIFCFAKTKLTVTFFGNQCEEHVLIFNVSREQLEDGRENYVKKPYRTNVFLKKYFPSVCITERNNIILVRGKCTSVLSPVRLINSIT